MDTAKAAFKFFLFIIACLMVIPPQLLVLAVTRGPAAYVLPRLWHKAVCAIFRIRVEVRGEICTDGQVLYVSNHLSYLDIPAIATRIKTASFIAKKDVENWPVFGFLSKLQQTAFISRSRKDAAKEAQNLDNMLAAGRSLIVFPEGTSTDGSIVKPFKSSLFEMLLTPEHKERLLIQPFTIRLVSAGGQPGETQSARDLYTWHTGTKAELPEHLWHFAKGSGAVLRLDFHPAIPAADFADRKTLAKTCHEAVSNGLGLGSQQAA